MPHDIELKNPPRFQTLVASAKNDHDAEEGSDRLGAPLIPEADDSSPPAKSSAALGDAKPITGQSAGAKLVEVSANNAEPLAASVTSSSAPSSESSAMVPSPGPTPAESAAGKGTVVLNVDSGIVVPSFMGKTLRSAVEVAQQSGLEINVLGSGIARAQFPLPGSHLLSGQKVTIRFSH